MSGDVLVRYIVTIRPGVSIGPRRYVREVVLNEYAPAEAIAAAFKLIEAEASEKGNKTQFWQSDEVTVTCERSA